MDFLAPALIVFATVLAMEWVAWASHKYIMHGFAWAWHRDHHEPHDNLLEKNDLFAIVGCGRYEALRPSVPAHDAAAPGPRTGWGTKGEPAWGYPDDLSLKRADEVCSRGH